MKIESKGEECRRRTFGAHAGLRYSDGLCTGLGDESVQTDDNY